MSLSRARLGRMHDVMAGYVERGDVPGIVTLVSRRGEVHVDAIGTKAAARPSVETMTTDQLTREQKTGSDLVTGYFESHGWGFGLSVVTRRDDVAGPVGSFGWDGGLGTSWRSDPTEDLTGILMTQRAWTSPTPPNVCLDFWTSVYQAID